MSPWMRVRTGIRRFPDGWNVIQERDGETIVFEPTFATEAEAEAMANKAAAAVREALRKAGVECE